jgi:hypothetical protein
MANSTIKGLPPVPERHQALHEADLVCLGETPKFKQAQANTPLPSLATDDT